MRRTIVLLSAGMLALAAGAASAQNVTPRNLILFVPDGLRGRIVTPQTAPAMAEVRDKGVNFKNSHSLFPTFTMANGSAMASGHYLGDTGVFSNTIYTGYSSVPAGDTVVPFIENDAVLGDIDEHFNGDYLNEETILKMARAQGFSTAAIGKLGPTLQFDHMDRGKTTVVIDDSTGGKNGVPISDEIKDALTKANLPLVTPGRGDNGKAGDAKTPGTTVANVAQQAYMADVAAKVVTRAVSAMLTLAPEVSTSPPLPDWLPPRALMVPWNRVTSSAQTITLPPLPLVMASALILESGLT